MKPFVPPARQFFNGTLRGFLGLDDFSVVSSSTEPYEPVYTEKIVKDYPDDETVLTVGRSQSFVIYTLLFFLHTSRKGVMIRSEWHYFLLAAQGYWRVCSEVF